MKSFVLHENGALVEYKPKGEFFTLAELQAAVGGYVEIIGLPNKRVMVIDEEGLPKQLGVNLSASRMYGAMIVGKVLVTNKELIK